jgi:uncharacterized protein YqjF (DUF2071 family)
MYDEQRGLSEVERHALDSLLSSHYSTLSNAKAKNDWWSSTSTHPTRLNDVQSQNSGNSKPRPPNCTVLPTQTC